MPFFSPVSAGGVPKATVTGTTGSPSVDTSSRAGKTIYNFTGSGSITIGTAGYAEVLIIGGGASGAQGPGGIQWGHGGGGAGGYVYSSQLFLPSGSNTVTIGAGGSAGNGEAGSASALGNYIALPGGSENQGNASTILNGRGASTAGRRGDQTSSSVWPVTTVPSTQGNTGGAGTGSSTAGGGGGGGSGGAGTALSTTSAGKNGGAGTANSITGTSVTYAGGGGGGGGSTSAGGTGAGGGGNGGTGNTSNGSNGTANSGGGGGGGGAGWSGGSGGSGRVIVVVG